MMLMQLLPWLRYRHVGAHSQKRNRKVQRGCGKYLYKLRHHVETGFPALKQWRGIASR